MKKKIVVNDLMQKAVYYLTEPTGKNFDPDFKKLPAQISGMSEEAKASFAALGL